MSESFEKWIKKHKKHESGGRYWQFQKWRDVITVSRLRKYLKNKKIIDIDNLNFLLHIIDENMGITSKEDYVKYKQLKELLIQ